MTTRFTSSAKVKVKVKSVKEITLWVHRFLYSVLFCDAKLYVFFHSAKQNAVFFTL